MSSRQPRCSGCQRFMKKATTSTWEIDRWVRDIEYKCTNEACSMFHGRERLVYGNV